MSLESNLDLSVFQQNTKRERENNSLFSIIMGANFEIERKFYFFWDEHKETLIQRLV